MLATALDVEHNRAGLTGKAKFGFGTGNEIEILFPRKRSLPVIGIDRETVEIFPALRRLGLCPPFGKSAMEILGDGAANVGNFHAVIVVGVQEVGCELLPAAALISFGDQVCPFLAGGQYGLLPLMRV